MADRCRHCGTEHDHPKWVELAKPRLGFIWWWCSRYTEAERRATESSKEVANGQG